MKLVSIVIKKKSGETKMNNYLKDEKKYSMKIPREKKIILNYDELGVKTLVNTARSFWEILCIWRTILNYLTKITK